MKELIVYSVLGFQESFVFTKKMLRNGLQFPFVIKGFPEINMRGFVETTPENVTLRKPERESAMRGAITPEHMVGAGHHSEVWGAGLLVCV